MIVTHPLGTFHAWDDIVGRALQTGVFWDEQIRSVLDAGDPAGWAIDLGANIGFHTVYLARRYAHVIAVEAHPHTFQLLVANLAANHITNVTALNLAAYDRLVSMALASSETVGWPIPDDLDLTACPHASSIAFFPCDRYGKLPLVPGVPIDALVPPDAPVSVIKSDVQGCDLRALVGLEGTIARCRPWVCYEIESGVSVAHGDDLQAHAAWFEARGYQVWSLGAIDYGARPR